MKAVASIAAVVIAVSTLAGCSTPGELKSTQPYFIMDSSKDSRFVAGCIAEKVGEKNNNMASTTTTRILSNGYAVQVDNKMGGWGTTTSLIIEVTEQPGGKSKVTGYLASDIREVSKKTIEGWAKECAK